MERPSKGDDIRPLRLAFVVPIFTGHLNRQLAAFCAGIGEKYRVGKRLIDQRISQLLLGRNVVQVRHMPQRIRLIRQRSHQRRMRMTQNIHRNARAQIQYLSPVSLCQPRAFTFDECQGCAGIGRQDGSDHSGSAFSG